MASSSSNPSPKAESCHILPCKIEYAGKAPIDVYFRPTEVSPNLQAAQFRGRGLLAKSPTVVQGRVLTVHEDQETVVQAYLIDNITEWQHEHLPQAVTMRINDSRVSRALEWCQIASALHQPLPLDVDDKQ